MTARSHSALSRLVRSVSTDYTDYGGTVDRWKDSQQIYPDCSMGCRFYMPLDGERGADWGVCVNRNSLRAGLLTFEHQAGFDCFKQETTMAKVPTKKLKGIPVKGVRLKDGKIAKTDRAPPHVKAGRRRKAGKITGARAAR